jgi:hypothetical protein
MLNSNMSVITSHCISCGNVGSQPVKSNYVLIQRKVKQCIQQQVLMGLGHEILTSGYLGIHLSSTLVPNMKPFLIRLGIREFM